MDSGFGEPPFAGGALHNSAAVTPRADPASDGAGSGGVDPFGRLDLALDLEPGFLLEHKDGCLQNTSEGYSPGTFEDTDAVPAVDMKVYDRERVLDNSWLQLEPKPVDFFWESGFWAEIFGAADSESTTDLVSKQFSLHRPAVVSEPVMERSLEEPAGSSDVPGKRLKVATYMDVVSKSCIQSWREQRDSTWEVAIRRWHSCAMTWKGDERIIQMLQEKTDFRGQCQILVDILHHKAPGTC